MAEPTARRDDVTTVMPVQTSRGSSPPAQSSERQSSTNGRTATTPPPTSDGAVQPPNGHRAPVPQPTPDGQAKQADPANVPDVPRRAPGVVVSGDMEESAFVEPQWLVQRDGKFVQLTELLFRVIEHVDGSNDLATIAERVSEAVDKDVTADNVRQLIATKLIPLGVVAGADGSVQSPSGGGRSPLTVNMKMAMLGPEVIDPLTAVLKVLYVPVVLVAMIAIAAAAQGWLYFVHGVGSSVHDALYNPTMLLVVLAVIVVATGFHELGHAAALTYGGGKVRGMGAGMYLIYPAFYTDVTDNYRLKRWARVRTDLGGIYFNVIFAAGIIGLYMLTGAEFLLVSVVVLNIQTVQQLLPFVRLDGYWILADLTGIPDFFTHMGAFLRSVLPIKSWHGRKLPELKWWAKAVFAGYILIVVPLLAFLLFVAVKSFPRIAATTVDSFRQQLGTLQQSASNGDVFAVVGSLLAMVLLALPALGLVYMLYRLAVGGFGWLWRWSEGSVPKRTVSLIGSFAAVSALVLMWLPQIPFMQPGTAGPLYRAAQWQPIAPTERGTVGDAVTGVRIDVPLSDYRPASTYVRATEIALTATAQPSGSPTASTGAAPAAETPKPDAAGTPGATASGANAAQTAAAAPGAANPTAIGADATPGAAPTSAATAANTGASPASATSAATPVGELVPAEAATATSRSAASPTAISAAPAAPAPAATDTPVPVQPAIQPTQAPATNTPAPVQPAAQPTQAPATNTPVPTQPATQPTQAPATATAAVTSTASQPPTILGAQAISATAPAPTATASAAR